MEYYNEMNIRMENNEAAQKAFEILKETMAKRNYDTDYRCEPSIRMIEAITVENNILSLSGDDGFYRPEDVIDVANDIFKAIGTSLKNQFVEGSIYTFGTYSESAVEANVKNNTMAIKSTYYPVGCVEFLTCEECDEDVIEIKDYDPNKEYICPECGAVLNLQEQYEEVAPQVSNEIIEL